MFMYRLIVIRKSLHSVSAVFHIWKLRFTLFFEIEDYVKLIEVLLITQLKYSQKEYENLSYVRPWRI